MCQLSTHSKVHSLVKSSGMSGLVVKGVILRIEGCYFSSASELSQSKRPKLVARFLVIVRPRQKHQQLEWLTTNERDCPSNRPKAGLKTAKLPIEKCWIWNFTIFKFFRFSVYTIFLLNSLKASVLIIKKSGNWFILHCKSIALCLCKWSMVSNASQ